MRLPRPWIYALIGLLLAPALGWATYRHIRESDAWDLVYAAATAHDRVGYGGTLASPPSPRKSSKWGGKQWSLTVENDAESGNTRYQFGAFGFTLRGPGRRSDPAGWCLDYELVKRNYSPRLRGEGRFLGRGVRILELVPKHEGRPLVQLTLDAATLLPLRVVTLSPGGEPSRTKAFRSVEIGPRTVAPGSGRPGTAVAPGALSEALGFEVLTPDYVPAGFRCVESRISKWAGIQATMFYTDGVTGFTIRQSRVQTPAAMEASLRKQMGPRRAAGFMRRVLSQRMRVLAENDDGSSGIPVRRRQFGSHVNFDLRVGDVDIHLSSRTDLDAEEILQVLRSLRRP